MYALSYDILLIDINHGHPMAFSFFMVILLLILLFLSLGELETAACIRKSLREFSVKFGVFP